MGWQGYNQRTVLPAALQKAFPDSVFVNAGPSERDRLNNNGPARPLLPLHGVIGLRMPDTGLHESLGRRVQDELLQLL